MQTADIFDIIGNISLLIQTIVIIVATFIYHQKT
jgi:hypothetical protein